MDKLKKIYEHMGDAISKELFCNRLLYNITSEQKYLDELIYKTLNYCKINEKKVFPFVDRIKNTSGEVIVYGAGSGGSLIRKYLDMLNIDIVAYCDADITKQGTIYMQKLVISPEDMLSDQWQGRNVYILICVFNPYIQKQIYDKLINLGFCDERIIVAVDYFGKQYFDATVPMSRMYDGIFIDAGCYDLGTAQEYRLWNMNTESEIISFEPDINCYERCDRILREIGDKHISLLQKGVWNCDGRVQFCVGSNGTTKVTNSSEGITFEVVSIDSIVKKQKCSFIKMDIEGVEFEALCGAEETIRREHPVLAISIYHKPDDIYKIPMLILEMSEKYRFYIRHYSTTASETILYAI